MMTLPNMPPTGTNIDIKVRSHNIMYRCTLCEEWHNQSEEGSTAVSLISGFEKHSEGLRVALVLVPVCPDCFKTYELSDTPPPEIHIATGPLPEKKP